MTDHIHVIECSIFKILLLSTKIFKVIIITLVCYFLPTLFGVVMSFIYNIASFIFYYLYSTPCPPDILVYFDFLSCGGICENLHGSKMQNYFLEFTPRKMLFPIAPSVRVPITPFSLLISLPLPVASGLSFLYFFCTNKKIHIYFLVSLSFLHER